jgi:hypothetical protein
LHGSEWIQENMRPAFSNKWHPCHVGLRHNRNDDGRGVPFCVIE